MSNTTKRNPSIEILKFLAALLITNSHMAACYPKFSFLSTGGAIGDVLFFFCSGFTIFLGRKARFDNWYKRRINRIYPTVLMWALLSSILFANGHDMNTIIFHGGGWCISCIRIYYVILYVIREKFYTRLKAVFAASCAVVMVWYAFEDSSVPFMYQETYFKWCHYFLFMLLGAIIGANKSERKYMLWKDLIMCGACIVIFYGILMLGTKWTIMSRLQIISLVPLLGTPFFLYKVCNSGVILMIYENKYVHFCVYSISALCLEIYLCQLAVITPRLNHIFPFNIPIIIIGVILLAYIVKVFSNFFSQTFKEQDYNWKAIFKL